MLKRLAIVAHLTQKLLDALLSALIALPGSSNPSKEQVCPPWENEDSSKRTLPELQERNTFVYFGYILLFPILLPFPELCKR